MSKKILLPVDLNNPKASLRPLEEALKLLDKDGELHVVSVMQKFGLAMVSGYFDEGFETKALDAFGKALTAWVNENVPDGVNVRPHVLSGTIYDEIIRAANRLSVDVIVMGSHRPEFQDYLLGPNAARVVRHAPQSVFVVRN